MCVYRSMSLLSDDQSAGSLAQWQMATKNGLLEKNLLRELPSQSPLPFKS